MKHALFPILLAAVTLGTTACSNQQQKNAPKPAVQTAYKSIDSPTFALFETQNMWTFIKLNTVNGKMWIVSYSVNSEASPFEGVLNDTEMISPQQERIKGRFTLIPTRNMWNFILLDQIDGKQWQVQWTSDGKNNMVVPIQ